MAEIEKLTGHGAPSVLLPGSKGQIYEDLDTGRLYECKGERGFIRVDGDDRDNQFNWVLKGVDISYNDLQDKPEQGGSTGGGSPFIVTLDVDVSSGSMEVSDKGKDVMDEIDSNYKAGKPVNAVVTYTITPGAKPVTVNFWLVVVQADNYYFMTAVGTYIIVFPDLRLRWSVREEQNVQQ